MTSVSRVAFYTLGCKLNFSETSTISRQFSDQHYSCVDFKEKADIYVINTCSVTESADKEFRRVVRSALKNNPKAFIIATGCYAQLKPEEIALTEGVDLVLGAAEKFKITDYLSDLSKKTVGEVHSCEIKAVDFYVGSYSIGDRTRSFLKVQDGCDYKCSYCTIPLARGVSRSSTLEKVLENAREIARTGVKEIVLTGINVGDYGKGEFGNKKHEHTFLELIKALDVIEEIERFRISSIEPNLLSDQIIEFVTSSKRFVPHFHIPLQSGSNDILRKMRRRYMRELYAEKVNKIKAFMPQACIGVDVIVGFPGESDEHFMETFHFLSELEISYLHVFTYSDRADTEAIRMEGEVLKAIRYKRNKALRGLSVRKRRQFYENQIGSMRKVLFEQENKGGFLYGYTENYIKVKAPWEGIKSNSVQEVRLKKLSSDGVMLADIMEITKKSFERSIGKLTL
nr:tRNA (N(6)-L-threonylcarbamoyladenosine(37)-C(2))-methylthiotransferase MtaB [Bacteroidetes bacterium endosymbiont of Geopemphigus sp.]